MVTFQLYKIFLMKSALDQIIDQLVISSMTQNISVVPVTIYDAATEAQYGLVLIPIASR